MNQLNNLTITSWDNLNEIAFPDKETSYTFTHDPLLISCTLRRMIKEAESENKMTYRNWSLVENMKSIVAAITDQDRLFAETVRSYYRSKLLVAKLRNEHFSKFRTDLIKYLEESPTKITSEFIGMVYKLPYFYEYDMQLTEIFGSEYAEVKSSLQKKDKVTLEFIAVANNGRKRCLSHEYWFKDSKDNRILVEVARNNPMLNLWDQVIKNGKINIGAKFEQRHKDNLGYYIANGWEINV